MHNHHSSDKNHNSFNLDSIGNPEKIQIKNRYPLLDKELKERNFQFDAKTYANLLRHAASKDSSLSLPNEFKVFNSSEELKEIPVFNTSPPFLTPSSGDGFGYHTHEGGYRGVAYVKEDSNNNTVQIVIASVGTDISNLHGNCYQNLLDDTLYAIGFKTFGYEAGKKFIEKVENKIPQKYPGKAITIEYAGHSLGGILTQCFVLDNGARRGITFESPGIYSRVIDTEAQRLKQEEIAQQQFNIKKNQDRYNDLHPAASQVNQSHLDHLIEISNKKKFDNLVFNIIIEENIVNSFGSRLGKDYTIQLSNEDRAILEKTQGEFAKFSIRHGIENCCNALAQPDYPPVKLNEPFNFSEKICRSMKEGTLFPFENMPVDYPQTSQSFTQPQDLPINSLQPIPVLSIGESHFILNDNKDNYSGNIQPYQDSASIQLKSSPNPIKQERQVHQKSHSADNTASSSLPPKPGFNLASYVPVIGAGLLAGVGIGLGVKELIHWLHNRQPKIVRKYNRALKKLAEGYCCEEHTQKLEIAKKNLISELDQNSVSSKKIPLNVIRYAVNQNLSIHNSDHDKLVESFNIFINKKDQKLWQCIKNEDSKEGAQIVKELLKNYPANSHLLYAKAYFLSFGENGYFFKKAFEKASKTCTDIPDWFNGCLLSEKSRSDRSTPSKIFTPPNKAIQAVAEKCGLLQPSNNQEYEIPISTHCFNNRSPSYTCNLPENSLSDRQILIPTSEVVNKCPEIINTTEGNKNPNETHQNAEQLILDQLDIAKYDEEINSNLEKNIDHWQKILTLTSNLAINSEFREKIIADANQQLALAKFSKGSFAESLVHIENIKKEKISNSSLLFIKGICLFDQKKHDEIEEAFQPLITKSNEDVFEHGADMAILAYNLLKNIPENNKKNEHKKNKYNEAIIKIFLENKNNDLNQNSHEIAYTAHVDKGFTLLLKENKPNEALECIAEWKSSGFFESNGHRLAAYCHYTLQDYVEAEKCAQNINLESLNAKEKNGIIDIAMESCLKENKYAKLWQWSKKIETSHLEPKKKIKRHKKTQKKLRNGFAQETATASDLISIGFIGLNILSDRSSRKGNKTPEYYLAICQTIHNMFPNVTKGIAHALYSRDQAVCLEIKEGIFNEAKHHFDNVISFKPSPNKLLSKINTLNTLLSFTSVATNYPQAVKNLGRIEKGVTFLQIVQRYLKGKGLNPSTYSLFLDGTEFVLGRYGYSPSSECYYLFKDSGLGIISILASPVGVGLGISVGMALGAKAIYELFSDGHLEKAIFAAASNAYYYLERIEELDKNNKAYAELRKQHYESAVSSFKILHDLLIQGNMLEYSENDSDQMKSVKINLFNFEMNQKIDEKNIEEIYSFSNICLKTFKIKNRNIPIILLPYTVLQHLEAYINFDKKITDDPNLLIEKFNKIYLHAIIHNKIFKNNTDLEAYKKDFEELAKNIRRKLVYLSQGDGYKLDVKSSINCIKALTEKLHEQKEWKYDLDAESWLYLGQAYLNMSNYNEARNNFKLAYDLSQGETTKIELAKSSLVYLQFSSLILNDLINAVYYSQLLYQFNLKNNAPSTEIDYAVKALVEIYAEHCHDFQNAIKYHEKIPQMKKDYIFWRRTLYLVANLFPLIETNFDADDSAIHKLYYMQYIAATNALNDIENLSYQITNEIPNEENLNLVKYGKTIIFEKKNNNWFIHSIDNHEKYFNERIDNQNHIVQLMDISKSNLNNKVLLSDIAKNCGSYPQTVQGELITYQTYLSEYLRENQSLESFGSDWNLEVEKIINKQYLIALYNSQTFFFKQEIIFPDNGDSILLKFGINRDVASQQLCAQRDDVSIRSMVAFDILIFNEQAPQSIKELNSYKIHFGLKLCMSYLSATDQASINYLLFRFGLSKEIYVKYIEDFIAKPEGKLEFSSIKEKSSTLLAIAYLNKKNIFIWQRQFQGKPLLNLLYQSEYDNDFADCHFFYTHKKNFQAIEGRNHFNWLKLVRVALNEECEINLEAAYEKLHDYYPDAWHSLCKALSSPNDLQIPVEINIRNSWQNNENYKLIYLNEAVINYQTKYQMKEKISLNVNLKIMYSVMLPDKISTALLSLASKVQIQLFDLSKAHNFMNWETLSELIIKLSPTSLNLEASALDNNMLDESINAVKSIDSKICSTSIEPWFKAPVAMFFGLIVTKTVVALGECVSAYIWRTNARLANLCKAIKNSKRTTELFIGENRIGHLNSKEFEMLIDSIMLSNVKTLSLRKNNLEFLSLESWQFLWKSFKKSKISYLDLSDTNLDNLPSEAWEIFIQGISQSSVIFIARGKLSEEKDKILTSILNRNINRKLGKNIEDFPSANNYRTQNEINSVRPIQNSMFSFYQKPKIDKKNQQMFMLKKLKKFLAATTTIKLNSTMSIQEKISNFIALLKNSENWAQTHCIFTDDIEATLKDMNTYYTGSYINLLLQNLNKESFKWSLHIHSDISIEQLDQNMFLKIQSQIDNYFFIPLSVPFDDNYPEIKNHWAALIIDKERQQIYYLDPAKKEKVPIQVSNLNKTLNYKNVITNSINFQESEIYIRHCGVYVVEFFKVFFAECIQKGKIISASHLNDPVLANSLTTLETVFSSIPSGVAEKALEIRIKHIEEAYQILLEQQDIFEASMSSNFSESSEINLNSDQLESKVTIANKSCFFQPNKNVENNLSKQEVSNSLDSTKIDETINLAEVESNLANSYKNNVPIMPKPGMNILNSTVNCPQNSSLVIELHKVTSSQPNNSETNAQLIKSVGIFATDAQNKQGEQVAINISKIGTKLETSSQNKQESSKPESKVLGFTDGIDLEGDSQKGCAIM